MRKRDMAVIAVLACTCLMLLSGCAKDINYIVDNEPCVRGIVSETSEDYIVIDVNEDDEIYENLIKPDKIANLLGYEDFDNYDEVGVYTRGYRILNKIPRMPSTIVENLVKTFKSFQHILAADIPQLDEVDGIGEIRARTIKQSLKRMQEQFVFDNLII